MPPSTGYDEITLTNPSAALTDFVLYIDLANLSTDFKAAWNTDSNGYGRVYKGDGVTELPCDWIGLNYSAGTGCLRVKWTGTLASTGTQKIRIYPPNTANSQYARADTYGQNAAWSGAIVAYPLQSDASERSGHGYDMTVSGAVLQAAGGYDFDGIDDYIAEGASQIAKTEFAKAFTLSVCVKPDSYGESDAGDIVHCGVGPAASTGFYMYIRNTGTATYYATTVNAGSARASANGSVSIGSWQCVTATISADSSVTMYVDGNQSGTPGATGLVSAIDNTTPLTIGNQSASTARTFDGVIKGVVIWDGEKSAQWAAYDYTQINDNATFVGTPTWVPGRSIATNRLPSLTISTSLIL